MDDITKGQSEKFKKAIKALKPKGKAMLDFMYGAHINQAEIDAPMEAFNGFIQSIIALNNRNNGQFSFEEAEAIIEIDDMFRNFFEKSELSTTLVNADEAYNKAATTMQSTRNASVYNQIMNKAHEVYSDNLLANISAEDLAYIETRAAEILTFIPSLKAFSGLFGPEIELGNFSNKHRRHFIQIKKSDIANTNTPR